MRAWGQITVLGLVNVTLSFAAMFAGIAGLATGTAAVLANAQPLLILLPAWWLYGEALSRRTALALVVGFAGPLLVAVPGGGGQGAVLAMAATIDIVACSFAGTRPQDGLMAFDQRLPEELRSARFRLVHRGQRLRVALDHTHLQVSADLCASSGPMGIRVGTPPPPRPQASTWCSRSASAGPACRHEAVTHPAVGD